MAIKTNVSNVSSFFGEKDFNSMYDSAKKAHHKLVNKTGLGSDFTGWVTLPTDYDRDEFARIKKTAEKIKKDSEVFVIIGIGGSYLGARAAIEFLKSPNYNIINRDGAPQIFFAGNNISAEHISEIFDIIGDRDFSVNVISKSGTTTEPSIAFRIFKNKLVEKYGTKGAADRIYATTDKSRGVLKSVSLEEGYETFVVPDDVGGRFSVLTAVGLLPIAVSGVDIDKLLAGAANQAKILGEYSPDNAAVKYAVARNICYNNGKFIEVLGCYEPKFRFLLEWWKQLYGESEGKDGKGIFPASVELTADLHSMGQYIQDGERKLFETIVTIKNPKVNFNVEAQDNDGDGLNFLAGTNLDYINKQAQCGTVIAHVDGGVPNIEIEMDSGDEFSLGEIIYFFEFACGISGYILDVNPFDQPGVETYKKNMFALLGKPGYEELREHLNSRL